MEMEVEEVEVVEKEWDECCICNGEKGDTLRANTVGIESLAQQFLEFWKNDVLPFDSAKITTKFVIGEDGIKYPDFKKSMLQRKAKYHHDCKSSFSPYHMNKKIKSLAKKQAKAAESTSFPLRSPLRSSTGSSSRTSSYTCIICDEADILDNLHAAGAYHASKSKLNAGHVNKLTKEWRDIAVYIGDPVLASRLAIAISEQIVHFTIKDVLQTCTINTQRRKMNKEV